MRKRLSPSALIHIKNTFRTCLRNSLPEDSGIYIIYTINPLGYLTYVYLLVCLSSSRRERFFSYCLLFEGRGLGKGFVFLLWFCMCDFLCVC